MEIITARTNDKIKYAVRLGESASFRKENGEFILEGARLCSDASISGVNIKTAFFTQKAFERYPEYTNIIAEKSGISYIIGEDVAKKLSDTEKSQGIFCVCKKKASGTAAEISPCGKYIATENLQDPSNLGAVSRSVEALGLDGLIVSGGCDIYNPKALRASMGSLLRLNVIETDDLPELLTQASECGIKTLASVPKRDALDIRRADMNGGVICCVGNEGSGLSKETIRCCKFCVTIPMSGRAESFNAAAAAAILAWELKR